MCVRCNYFYPLIKDKTTQKKKVLFNYPFVIDNKNYYKDFYNYKLNIRSKFTSINTQVIDFINVPCGICSECLNSKARNWVSRLMLESKLHDYNYFITLTYDDEFLKSFNLIPDDLSKFIKSLRQVLKIKYGIDGIRFYGVGEYGHHTARPHFHLILFSDIDLSDDFKFYKNNEFNDPIFTSDFFSNVWKKGFVTIGYVSPASCAYVARYCEKKRLLTSKEKKVLLNNGIVPEFSRMSRRPGIASDFLDLALEKFSNNEKLVISNGISDLPYYFLKKAKESGLIELDRDINHLKLNNAFYFTGLNLGDYLLIQDSLKLKQKNKRAF